MNTECSEFICVNLPNVVSALLIGTAPVVGSESEAALSSFSMRVGNLDYCFRARAFSVTFISTIRFSPAV